MLLLARLARLVSSLPLEAEGLVDHELPAKGENGGTDGDTVCDQSTMS